jgi:hypothetical protein
MGVQTAYTWMPFFSVATPLGGVADAHAVQTFGVSIPLIPGVQAFPL